MDLDRPYWNMEVEPKFNTPEMRQMQNDLLLRNMQGMYDRIPLTRKRMDEAGVRPSDIKCLEDLQKIPVFGQPQMRELIAEVGFDMKKILEMTMGPAAQDIYVMAATSGTTGMPTPYPVLPAFAATPAAQKGSSRSVVRRESSAPAADRNGPWSSASGSAGMCSGPFRTGIAFFRSPRSSAASSSMIAT